MKTCAWFMFVGWILASGCLTPAIAETVYLDATFDDKTIDEPIGTGGAVAGEPIQVSPRVTAIVRSAPCASPSLEVTDAAIDHGGEVQFEFLDDAEVMTGLVVIAMDLWFSEATEPTQQVYVYVREHGSSSEQFLNMFFYGDGDLSVHTATAWADHLGPYAFGRAYPIVVVINMDTGLLSIWLDGVRAVTDLEHGVIGRGIGRVEIGMMNDADLLPVVWVDRLRVSDTPPETPVESTTWGEVKALFRP